MRLPLVSVTTSYMICKERTNIMRTTNDPKEAWKALAEGKHVLDSTELRLRLHDQFLQEFISSEEYWEAAEGYIGNPPYTIIEPEPPAPKRLSFDEAMDIRTKAFHKGYEAIFQIKLPMNDELITTKYSKPREILFMLDLAERRGWPITEVGQ